MNFAACGPEPQAWHPFTNAVAYERLMGRWSRAAGSVFLEWLEVPPARRWLEVGCGTGVFTQLIEQKCAPSALVAVDTARPLLAHARRRSAAPTTRYMLADAQALPFPRASFEVIVSALAVNFIPERLRAVREMHRVSRADGIIAGYVWDFAAQRSPSWPLRNALAELGRAVPMVTGAADSTLDALQALWKSAGCDRIAVRTIEVTEAFPDFKSFWRAQVSQAGPVAEAVRRITHAERRRLIGSLRERLAQRQDGPVAYSSRANAVAGHAYTGPSWPSARRLPIQLDDSGPIGDSKTAMP